MMTKLYDNLKAYNPELKSGSVLITREINDTFTNGEEILFSNSEKGLEVCLRNNVLQIASTSNGIKRSYKFIENQALRSQSISLVDEHKELEFLYSQLDDSWRDAFLKVKDEIVTHFSIMNPDDNPDDYIKLNDEDAFNRRLYRWSSGHESHENSSLVSEIMQYSKGIIREDMSAEIVCEMFGITKQELAEIPTLLIEKSRLLPK